MADLGRDRVKRYGLKLYPSIEEALTLGTGKLAVDGVVIIAEHGKYPRNEKGQTLYPRYEWFKECVKVFEKSGRGVPVFNDKHLSTTWARCKEMVDDAKRLKFPFFAGSLYRSRAGCRRSICRTTSRLRRVCAWPTAGWIATTFTRWRPRNACPSGGAVVRLVHPAGGTRDARSERLETPCGGSSCGHAAVGRLGAHAKS